MNNLQDNCPQNSFPIWQEMPEKKKKLTQNEKQKPEKQRKCKGEKNESIIIIKIFTRTLGKHENLLCFWMERLTMIKLTVISK